MLFTEGSPAGFAPDQYTTNPDFDARSGTIYNELMAFRRGTLDLESALASRDVYADQHSYTFHLRRGVKFHTIA